MVFFSDKSSSPFTLTQPSEFLSERSLQRRLRNNVTLSEEDLPVDFNYISQVKNIATHTFYSTKWLNGVLVQMTEQEKSEIEQLTFVRNVELVKRAANTFDLGGLKSSTSEEPVVEPAHLASFQNSLLGIDEMHNSGIKGEGVLIGVFDDGFQSISSNPYFEPAVEDGRIIYQYDFVNHTNRVENNEDHGLRAMSVMAAEGPDYQGITPEASYFLAVTEASQEWRIEEYNWLFAAEKADSAGVDIISTSLGYAINYTDPAMNYELSDMDGNTAVVTFAAEKAFEKGILVVASAGNLGRASTGWEQVTAPADGRNVMAIGVIDSDFNLASFSGKGAAYSDQVKPDLVAIGVATALVNASSRVTFQNGTSFSAPQVAGLAAGILEAFPSLTAVELLDVLRNSGDQSNFPNNLKGYGIPNFERAIDFLNREVEEVQPEFSVYPNPISDGNINLILKEAGRGQSFKVEVINLTGETVYSTDRRLFADASLNLALNTIPSGVYIIRISNSKGTSSRKFIKY